MLKRAALPLLVLIFIACKGGGAESTNVDGGSGGDGPIKKDPPSEPDAAVVVVDPGPEGPPDTNPPPGCTDGGPNTRFFLIDDTRIRITSLEGSPQTMCTGTGGTKRDCAFDYFDAILTVPSTAAAGSWTLPSPEVTLNVIREFPIHRSSAGCVCQAEITTPRAITSGKITLEKVSSGPPFASVSITLDQVSFDQDVSGANTGKQSSLIEACN